MNQFSKQFLLPACALVALIALSACGGSDNPAPQPTAPQSITFASPGDQTFGAAPGALVATASSGLTVSFASTTPTVCTASGTVLTVAAAGTCTVAASQSGNGTYLAATPVSNSFVVAPGAQTISFVSPGNQTLGTAPAALMATATSNLPVTFSSPTPGVCTVSGTTLTLVSAGTCLVDANQAGNANYAAAAQVEHSVTIAAAPLTAQTITFASPGNQTLGTAAPALVGTSTSGLTVAFASTTPAVCTVSGTTLALVAVGTCTVVASQAGDVTHAAATNVPNTFNVAPAAQAITFAQPASQTFGVAPPALVATSSSGLTVSFASTTPGVCTVSGTALALTGAGTCTVTASQAGNGMFAGATPVPRSFTVALGAQTITFTSPGNQTLGTAPPALVASSTSGLTVSFASSTPLVCTVSGTALTLVGAGACTVVASQAGNANYAAATPFPNTFTVSAVALTAQSINFAQLASQTLGVAAPALAATATSGLTVSFASITPSVCTVSGTTLTLVAAGTCTVNASQAGNGTYSAAPVVPNSFTVAAAALTAQTINFPPLAGQTLGTAPPALTATATSGLTVSFTSITPAVCTVSGTTLTLLAGGTCSITAGQAGNATYSAAMDVTNSFTVTDTRVELIADGGFETAAVVVGQYAQGWRGTNSTPAVRTNTDAHSGTYSTLLQVPDPGLGGSGLAGNSVDDGGLVPVAASYAGKSPVLTFWVKGNISTTGVLSYDLRYLNAIGNILNSVTGLSQTLPASQINTLTWTQISFSPGAIPVGTTAVFFEMTLAAGPTGVQPPGNCGVDNITGLPLPCDYGQAKVWVDDVSLKVTP